MTEVSHYTRNLTGPVKSQPDRARLSHCLLFWGVRPLMHKWRERRWHVTQGSTKLCNQSVEKLWDYYEAAEQARTRMIVQCHPDRGGDESTAALVNAMWDRTRLLFSRLGIGEWEKPLAHLIPAFTRPVQPKQPAKKVYPLITCACGCGLKLPARNKWRHKSKFINGHYRFYRKPKANLKQNN